MADIATFRSYTSTPARRHTFYCYCTQNYVQDQAIFFILVEVYRANPNKRRALFLDDWFIKGNIPDDLQAKGYLTIVNISHREQEAVSASTSDAVAAVGRTFSDKMAKHGGGVGGFLGALRQKAGSTTLSASLFDQPQNEVVGMLDDERQGFGREGGTGAIYQPDGTYQPLGTFASQVPIFRRHLKTAGFDPDQVGIY